MSDELDLEKGDAKRAEKIASRQTGGKKTSNTPSSGGTRQKSTATQRVETELRSRLDRTFDRIAEALQARGDDEMSQIIIEDKDAMGQGIVSLTRTVKWLRNPLLMALNLVEPVLAFGRVGRVMFERWSYRRAAAQQPGTPGPEPIPEQPPEYAPV